MKPVAVDYGYDVEWKDDHYLIVYKRGKFGFPYFLLFIIPSLLVALILCAPITFGLNLSPGFLFVTAIVIGAGIAGGLVRLLNTRRKDRIIEIYRDYVAVDGKSYEQAHIRDLYVKAPNIRKATSQVDNRVSTGGMLGAAGVFGVAGIAASGLGAMTQGINNVGAMGDNARESIHKGQAAKSGWSIYFDYGQKPVRVAKGLSEKRAAAMAQDLHRLIFVEF